MLPFRRIAVAFAALLTVGCYDSRFGEPDGGASGEPATETIAALRALYAGTPFTVTGDIVVAGRVTTSDRAENFYRTLCIEDNEAGLEVMAGIDHLHNDFPDGCRVTLRLKGLTVAESRGVLQVGRPPAAGSGYATDYIGSQPALAAVLVRSGESLNTPAPALRRIPELTPALCGTLIRIDGLRYMPEDLSASTWSGYKRFADSDGNIVGFDADMLVELEKYMNEDGGNYDLQFRQMEFNAILSQLPAKQLDMAISGFTYDEERKVAWSDPYTATAQVAVMPKDTEITSVDDLKGKTIAAQTASTGEKAANEIEDANVQSISDVKVIFSGLASGQYDAAVVDLAVAKNYVDSGGYVMLGETLMDEKNYIITYEGNDELLEKVNAALEKFMASDRYVELCDQYGVKALEE